MAAQARDIDKLTTWGRREGRRVDLHRSCSRACLARNTRSCGTQATAMSTTTQRTRPCPSRVRLLRLMSRRISSCRGTSTCSISTLKITICRKRGGEYDCSRKRSERTEHGSQGTSTSAAQFQGGATRRFGKAVDAQASPEFFSGTHFFAARLESEDIRGHAHSLCEMHRARIDWEDAS